MNNLKGEEIGDKTWDKRDDWCRSMVNLNKSMEKTKKVKNTKDRKKILKAYRKRGEEIIQKRKTPEEGMEEMIDKTVKNSKKVTFKEHQERKSQKHLRNS